MSNKRILRHRCHWCDNRGCPHYRHERVIEGGCPHYIMADPMLRKRRWENADGTPKARIRHRATCYFDPVNLEFLRNARFPNTGRKGKRETVEFTRKVHYIVEYWLDLLNGAMPTIPPDTRKQVEGVSVTLMPDRVKQLDAIVKHWKDTKQSVNRSLVVDYFVTLTRQAAEKMGVQQ